MIPDAETIYAGLAYSVVKTRKDGRQFSRFVIASSWEAAEEQCGPNEIVDGRVEGFFDDDGAAEQFMSRGHTN